MDHDSPIRVALAVPLEWEYAHRLTEGILAFQHQHGGYLLRDFRFSDPNFQRPEDPPAWDGWQPHGVVCAVGDEPGLADWLLESGLPMVNMTADVPQDVIPSVHACQAGELAFAHLTALGYRSIAHVGLQGLRGSQLRSENLRRAAEQADVEFYVYELEHDPVGSSLARVREAASEPGFLEFLAQAPKPLGVAAMNDDFARCVCVACEALGLAIPKEVAVVGVDDTSVARLNVPPISSVCPPGDKVGYEAMHLLSRLIEGHPPPKCPIEIPCETINVRRSTQESEDGSVERALRLIESEACKGLSVAELVEYLDVSRSTFEKQFSEQIGHTPAAEIQRVKLETAKRLLTKTELSITRITGMIGFSRSSVFDAFFRKHENQTPTQYRQQHRG